MEMKITFPGGQKVNAEFKGKVIATDQPVKDGGEDSAPSPFNLFLASIGTCTGWYAQAFCQQRKIDTTGLSLNIDFNWNKEAHLITEINIYVTTPKDFPDNYRKALEKAISLCTVKRHLEQPPSVKTIIQ